ncbi:MAG: menE [Ilumatobacteraceae bacterium]|nr:menE [Ilumatobacteraceae bacterium]
MPSLVALDLPGGDAFVDALQRVWARGDAVLPIDQRLPTAARRELVAAMHAGTVIDADGQQSVGGGLPTELGDALVMATSGSTGSPKGVVLTHEAVAASAVATSARLGVGADDRWLACLPLAHVGGLSVVTRALHTGAPLTVLPGFDADAVTAAAADGVTLTSLVATALRRIDPAIFRCIVLGGSRPPVDRPANTVTTYGLTETGSGVVYDGVPLDGVEIELTADREILIRCPMLLRAYRDGSTPIDAQGWLHTGDLGGVAADGRLQVEGRAGDLIISGGENVWPETVEAALADHPQVADVGVAGVDDPEWGQRVVAWVIPADPAEPPTLAALRDHVRVAHPAFIAPRSLVLVDTLPRTALGKLRRAELVAGLDRDRDRH